ncbi:MAG: SH3 domain-containing protein [Sphaerobacter sp.]|nr:SH3 domain-containing protein [Sphaerobacter sp.]
MTVRKCSTCKHYEPAPIWRKGWCRNPLLYSPQQSHLVGEDDLDCDRGMGNYWEPAEEMVGDGGVEPTVEAATIGTRSHPDPYGDPDVAPLHLAPPRSARGGDMHRYSGGRRPDDPDDEEDIQHTASYERPRAPFTSGSERQFTYYSDERYWTDYLRIAVPVVGVILMLGFVWFLFQSLLGDGTGSADEPTDAGTVPTVVVGASPTTGAGAVGTPRPLPTSGTDTPAQPDVLRAGATVVVANTGGSGVNLRDTPSASGEVVATLAEGTELTITGESVTADGYTWWPVETDEGAGYVVEDYLDLAP